MSRYLLDTCAFLKAVLDEGLGSNARRIMLNGDNERLLSTLSLVEIKMSIDRQRFKLTDKQLTQALDDLQVTVIAFNSQHAKNYFKLPFLDHRDPIDRMLIATALSEHIPILTSDLQFAQYEGLEVFW